MVKLAVNGNLYVTILTDIAIFKITSSVSLRGKINEIVMTINDLHSTNLSQI